MGRVKRLTEETTEEEQTRDNIILEAALHHEEGTEATGKEWEVVIIGPSDADHFIKADGREFVISQNGRAYDTKSLRDAVKQFEGVKVFDNHLTDEEFTQRRGMRSPANEWLGTIVKTFWDDKTKQIKGLFKVVERSLAEKLKNAWDVGVLGSIGLSIDTYAITDGTVRHEGRTLPVVTGFSQVNSVDLVVNAAAGGGFSRLVASSDSRSDLIMEREEIEQLVRDSIAEAIGPALADALTAREGTEVIEDANDASEVEELEEEETAEEVSDSEEEDTEEVEEAEELELEEVEEEDAEEVSAMEAVRRLESQLMVRDLLDAAKLRPDFRRVAELALKNKARITEAEVNAMIKSLKKAQSSGDPSGTVNAGGTRTAVGMNERDWAEVEFLRLVAGNTAFRSLENNEDNDTRDRLPKGYQAWVKSGRERGTTHRMSQWMYELIGGNPLTDQRALEAVTTSGMTSIIKNTVNLMLAANYSVRERWWEPIVRTEEVDNIDQATLVRVYGLSNLSVVTEGSPYTELTWADEEETASFVKKGNYLGITLETLLSDKLNVIRSIPDRLADSWYNTISALVSGVFTVNTAAGPVLADTGALFNATAATTAGGHANLLTTALSHAAYGAARTAMLKQTSQTLGTGRRLMPEPRFLLVPVDLETTGLQIRNTAQVPGGANNDVNPYYQQFDVIKVPDWTDTNNWALVADPARFPAIWLIFLTGLRVPEIFTADSETGGTLFTNDTIRYKVRMMTYRFSATYDCAPVSDFRPLHKSNVA